MALTATAALSAQTTETILIDGTEQRLVKLVERQIGPGTVYTRYRMPDFPLNINMVRVDVTNPHIKIETSVANEKSAGTELLVEAAKRYDAPNHHAICAQNSNFWIVSTQPQWDAYNASTHNVSLRNGMMSIDSKSFPHWWWWDTTRSGIVSVTDNNELYIDLCQTEMTFSSAKTGTREFTNCNKGFKTGQTSIYTPFFGPDRQFLPLVDDTDEQKQNNDIRYTVDTNAQCTEVLLRMAPGESWSGGRDMKFTVAEVRASDGRGTLGDYDLAIVTRGNDLAVLTPGDEVTLNYSWVFNYDSQAVRPLITQAVGGNMMVMRHGQITEQDKWDSYNTMVYSRSAYGSSEDNKTLFMVTIDKSNDPRYGASNGCTTDQMCQLMRHLGCWNLINVDAGGSAELMVDNRIINPTTEGTPRAVGNGWMVFNTAPDDDSEVATIAFEDVALEAPAGAYHSPKMLAFNKYGTVVNTDYKDFTLTCSAALGTCEGRFIQAAATEAQGSLTATLPNGFSVTKDMRIVAAVPEMRVKNIILDSKHPYPIEVKAMIGSKEYTFNPAAQQWKVEDESVARVDASGVLHAVNNGSTRLTGTFGGVSETVDVNVETSPTVERALNDGDWTGWKASGNSGLTKMTLGADGTIAYTYGAPRGIATVSLTKAITLFGMPERVEVTFVNDIPTTQVEAEIRVAGTKRGSVKVVPEEAFAAGQQHTVVFQLSEAGDTTDRANYPFSMASVKFTSKADTSYKGARSLKVTGLKAIYDVPGGVTDIATDGATAFRLTANVAAPGEQIGVSGQGLERVEVYSLSGVMAASATAAADQASFIAPSVPGLYLVRAWTRRGASAARLLVK